MSPIASEITSVSIVCSIIGSGRDQRKHQRSASLAIVREFTGDRWIPRTKGQWCGQCFHLIVSPCIWVFIPVPPFMTPINIACGSRFRFPKPSNAADLLGHCIPSVSNRGAIRGGGSCRTAGAGAGAGEEEGFLVSRLTTRIKPAKVAMTKTWEGCLKSRMVDDVGARKFFTTQCLVCMLQKMD